MKTKLTNRLFSFLLVLSFMLALFPQVTFATGSSNSGVTYLVNRDFTSGLSETDLTNINSYNVGTSDGLVREPYNMADIENGANGKGLVVKTTGSSTTWSPASLIFYNGSGALTGSHYKPAGSMDLNGAIVLEAEMMFETVADTTYYPLSIVPDESGSGSIAYNYADRMIKIANGRCYINNTDVGEIKAGTYYSFKLHMQIDGDETTTNDPFIATVSDGTNTYTGSGRICHIAAGDHYGTKVISYIHVLKVLAPSTVSTESPVNAYIKNLKIYSIAAPTVTASIADGATGVQEGSNITLTFNQAMNTTTFSKINLLDKDNTTVTGLTVTPSNDTTCVVTLPKALTSFAPYKLVIPNTVATPQGIGTNATTVSFTAGESKYVIPNVSFSIQEGAKDIKEGSTITVSFDQDMKTETYNNIILQDGDSNPVTGLKVTATDKRNCVVTLPSYLKSLSKYKLIVPGTVQSYLEVGVADTSISFTAAQSNTLLYRDFTNGVSSDDVTAMQSSKGTSDGLVAMTSSVIPEDGTDSLKLTMKHVGNASFAPSFFFGTGGMTSRKFSESLKLDGIVVLEAEMMFDTVAGMEYYPLSIVRGDESEVQKGSYVYNYAKNIIQIKDGRCYINSTDVGEIKPDTYYTFTVDMQVDGDAGTENDPFTATVSDGTNTYTGSGKLYSALAADYYTFTSIGFVNVLRMVPKTGAADINAYIKSLKFYKKDVTTVSANVEDGNNNENVDVKQDLVLTFTKKIQASEFRRIKLYKANGQEIEITVTPLTDMTDTCTVTVPGGMENNRVYTLSVPTLPDETQYKSEAREITFVTKPKAAPVTMSAITINDGGALSLSGGATVKASASFTNQTTTTQDASLIICVYNSENRLKKLGFSKQSLAANASNVTLEATVTVPADIGDNAYIRIFALDSLEDMNALTDMTVLP